MKNAIIVFLILITTSMAMSQTAAPQASTVKVNKVVKVGTKWYIEENVTTKTYKELTTEMLLGVDRDDDEDARESAEIARATELKKENTAERKERNKLLNQAIKSGFVPEAKTLEEVQKIESIKKRIEKIK